jgi:hypothetical protein
MNSAPKIVIDPLYAASIKYWVLLINAREALLETRSFYRKGSFRNRCHIYGANGLLRLSIPLQHGKHQRSHMDEVLISYDHPWQKLHWESLSIAYRSSPFFVYYEEGLVPFFQKKTVGLLDFNMALMEHIAGLIGLVRMPDLTSEYNENYDADWKDLRDAIHPNPLKDIISGFVSTTSYLQVFSSKLGYIPDLSILDLLFHKGPATMDYLQKETSVEWP